MTPTESAVILEDKEHSLHWLAQMLDKHFKNISIEKMKKEKRKLQYVTLLWEELPEVIHVLVIPRSAMQKGDVKILKACHRNYINSSSHFTDFEEDTKKIDRSLIILQNMLVNPKESWITDSYIDEQADQLNMERDDFMEYFGRWHEFKIEQDRPRTLPRSKFYRSGMLM